MFSRFPMLVAVIGLSVVPLGACSQQPSPRQTKSLVAMRAEVSQLKAKLAAMRNQTPQQEWVLWHSRTSHNGLVSSGTAPQSAYATKDECLQAAHAWSLPGSRVLSLDPYIFEKAGVRWTYSCLPRDVTPYATQ